MEPFTLITMLCWLGGPPHYDQSQCDLMNARHEPSENYLACRMKANLVISRETDPLFQDYGGTHMIAFCVPTEVHQWLLHDDDVLTADGYADVWAKGDIKTTYTDHGSL